MIRWYMHLGDGYYVLPKVLVYNNNNLATSETIKKGFSPGGINSEDEFLWQTYDYITAIGTVANDKIRIDGALEVANSDYGAELWIRNIVILFL